MWISRFFLFPFFFVKAFAFFFVLQPFLLFKILSALMPFSLQTIWNISSCKFFISFYFYLFALLWFNFLRSNFVPVINWGSIFFVYNNFCNMYYVIFVKFFSNLVSIKIYQRSLFLFFSKLSLLYFVVTYPLEDILWEED